MSTKRAAVGSNVPHGSPAREKSRESGALPRGTLAVNLEGTRVEVPAVHDARGIADDVGRLMAQLRLAFFEGLASALDRPTTTSDELRLLCWRTQAGRLEDAGAETHFEPSQADPLRPLVVRVLINKGSLDEVAAVARRAGILAAGDAQSSRPLWSLEMFMLPHEVLPHVPFLATLIRSTAERSALIRPPVSTTFMWADDGNAHAWSDAAWAIVESYDPKSPVQLRELKGVVPPWSRPTL